MPATRGGRSRRVRLSSMVPTSYPPARVVVYSAGLMDCWTCERTALAACRFCGRGVCREHAKTMPFVLEVLRGRPPDDGAKALVVDAAIHCGVCSPRAA